MPSSRFLGLIQGSHGQVTRLGGKRSGMETLAASFQGAVNVKLYTKDGIDYGMIELVPHPRDDMYGEISKVLYDGPVSAWKDHEHAENA